MVYSAYLNAVSEPAETDQTFEEYADSAKGLVGLGFKLPGGAIPAVEFVEDLLYGVYLHGYPERYQKVKEFRSMFDDGDSAVRDWTAACEKHLHGLSHQIFMAEVEGRLSLR